MFQLNVKYPFIVEISHIDSDLLLLLLLLLFYCIPFERQNN